MLEVSHNRLNLLIPTNENSIILERNTLDFPKKSAVPGKTHEHVLHTFTGNITGSSKSSVDYKRGEFGPTLYQLKPLEPIKVDDAFVEYPATIDQIAVLLKTLDKRSARHGVGEIENISKTLGRLSQIVLWLDGNNSTQDKLEEAQTEYLKKLAAYKAGREVLRLV